MILYAELVILSQNNDTFSIQIDLKEFFLIILQKTVNDPIGKLAISSQNHNIDLRARKRDAPRRGHSTSMWRNQFIHINVLFVNR